MKTEKIEIWVSSTQQIVDNIKDGRAVFSGIAWSDKPGDEDWPEKLTLIREMPEREGTFTEGEIHRALADHDEEYSNVVVDKLFNGEFKDG